MKLLLEKIHTTVSVCACCSAPESTAVTDVNSESDGISDIDTAVASLSSCFSSPVASDLISLEWIHNSIKYCLYAISSTDMTCSVLTSLLTCTDSWMLQIMGGVYNKCYKNYEKQKSITV